MTTKTTAANLETKLPASSATILTNVFEERAENLSREDLLKWSIETKADRGALAKLKGPGAKLLIGPRGSGKSTLLRKAYYDLIADGDTLTAYVNYSRSLALEPLFHRRSDALLIFRQWLVFKVIDGIRQFFEDSGRGMPEGLGDLAAGVVERIQDLEVGDTARLEKPLAPSALLSLLELWTANIGAKSCVLLLDDAAHVFSFEQQRAFFEVFRELRSRVVHAKAAVYPGVTAYSPFFNVGHEAGTIEAWTDIDDAEYLPVMRELAEKRLPPEMRRRLEGRTEIVDYLAYASFGMPRGFIGMLSTALGVEVTVGQRPVTRADADHAIAQHSESIKKLFGALSGKLTRFRRFVEHAETLEGEALRVIKTFNSKKIAGKKTITIAIKEPIETELSTILELLQYAGLIRQTSSVSRGIKGKFQKYALHVALVLNENALALGKNYTIGVALASLKGRPANAFVRTQGTSLLGKDFRAQCVLDLAPCPSCNAPRASPDAKYCVKCGTSLKDASIYEELLRAPIDRLPLTKLKLQGLLEHTDIRRIQDILFDEGNQKLRSVPSIGAVWAARIRTYAEEFLSL